MSAAATGHGYRQASYLKRDVLAAQADFQLLLAVLVLGRPFRIVLPNLVSAAGPRTVLNWDPLLHDLARFDDPLDLVNHQRADAHCWGAVSRQGIVKASEVALGLDQRTLFPDEAVIAIVGVVGISGCGAPSVSYDTKVEFCRPNIVSFGLRTSMERNRSPYQGTHGRTCRSGQSCRNRQKASSDHLAGIRTSSGGRMVRCWRT